MKTLYECATEAMQSSISLYLQLVDYTNEFVQFEESTFLNDDAKQMILSGKYLEYQGLSARECIQALERVKSIKFDIEKGVSAYVYENARKYIEVLIEEARQITNNFSTITANQIKERPYLLPVWQSALNITSKANIKALFGSASDQSISMPSAIKIADYAGDYFTKTSIEIVRIKERIERTLEGIVRDLVGRLLFEAIVKNALDLANVPYLTEGQYDGIDGVVYKFRADFVIPDEKNPAAFIEVRKSSSRHASLYAKDKMFSAINWKGKNKKLLAIVVTEGEWTNESLIAMSKVFDYVVPVSNSKELAEKIRMYINGDNSILKWIINFSISENK